MNLPIGTLLQGGRYEILRYISSGGFGCTYEARDNKFKSKVKSVAIKEFFVKDFCNRDPESNSVLVATQSKTELIERLQQKFIEEAEALYDLAHPNIVRVTDKFEENNTAYYVMDYIDGRSLGKLIDEKGPLGESEAIGYIKQIASALGFVHSHNRLHLDVKPQNIMIDQSGKAVLIDFGVSKQYDEVNGENTSTLLGCTPGYAPIEQSGNGVSEFYPSTDIYALGATLYKALTGETPLPAHQRASSKRLKELQFPEGISPATREAVECSMQLYVDNRPQSVAEFLELLKGSKDLRDPKASNEEDLIDDVDVEVTVLPDERVLRTDNRVQRVNPKAVEADNEEPRAVEKETERATSKINDPVAKPKKNHTALVAVVVLLGILVGGGLFFAFLGGNDRLAAHSEEPATTVVIEDTEDEKPIVPAHPVVNTDSIVAARMQAYQDSINAANTAREREEQNRLAEQQAAEEAARREREEAARLEREEAARLAREQQQGISTQKKVDLGLSVCWAGWNVGASSPEGYGNYYAWGETTTKSDYSKSSYQYLNGRDYVNIGSNISGTHYDAACAQWGGSWRMPTKAEFQELKGRCTWTWTTYNNVNGYKVTGPNGNSIFLPAADYRRGTELGDRGSDGLYWSGSLNESSQGFAYYLKFGTGGLDIGGRNVLCASRELGFSVRPVCNK